MCFSILFRPAELETGDVFFDELFTRLDFDEGEVGDGFDCMFLPTVDVGYIASTNFD